MKAAVRHEYGPPEVLRLEEVRKPTPREDEVLVRVRAASVNLGDWELLTGRPRWIAVLASIFGRSPRREVASSIPRRGRGRQPRYKILGTDFAGRVEAVGSRVTRFRPGDEVLGDSANDGFGAFAEYVCVREKAALVAKPPGMSFEQAAALPQATFIAVQGIRDKGRVGPGKTVLVNGAGGGAGSFAVQLARHYGAEITGVDGPEKLELMRSIGARHVVDYTREDFAHGTRRYDLILDLAAYRTVFESRRALAPGGIYLVAGGSGTATWQSVFLGPLISSRTKGRVAMLLAASRSENLSFMLALVAAGEVVPVVDRSYPLEQAGEALRRVGEKRSQGKVLITA